MEIKDLFSQTRDIYRPIEKVITYSADQESRLKSEIAEYIVTDSIEEAFQDLLRKMQWSMEAGDVNEIGVWVSGFYGSGKSSFTKYLGLALDQNVKIENTPFLEYLQGRMNKPQTRALLSTVAKKYPVAVVMLDLASEMLSGATKKEVSTVLYYKVLQEAGFSQNLKVAALERKLKEDDLYEVFKKRVKEEIELAWKKVQNDPLIIDSLVPELAHEFYPNLFKTPTSFTPDASEFIRFENERVEEMLNIIREATGKEYVIFIIDELGQYVASLPDLILNVDGLAKNIKEIGQGKAWLIGTAQQTLTEDDPRAALNSPELYKLQARFPIQIDLPAKDIKEICYRRLLGKSPDGEETLGELFDKHGQALRHNTKLENAAYYNAEFDKQIFTNLYPFLPAHFDILLHLLGALAKSTGGAGLRSAIKVIQDILIEKNENQDPLAEQAVGKLATTVTLYDALEKAIQRANPSIYNAVNKALIRFPQSIIHQEVAKTVAVLQILGNMPISEKNIASLTHPTLDSPSLEEPIKKAIEELKIDSAVPFGEKDGNLMFFSEKVNEIEKERAELVVHAIDRRRIQNAALGEVFTPLPSTRINNSLTVTSGLKIVSGGQHLSLKGDRETIQTLIEFTNPADYETTRNRILDESRMATYRQTVFLLGRTQDEHYQKISEIFRSKEIANRHRNDADQEVREYCQSQLDRAAALTQELESLLKNQLTKGSFIFKGKVTAVETLSQDLIDAAKKHLADVAERVFDRYEEAPVRVETNLAEKILKLENLKAVTKELDPLDLIKIEGHTPTIQSEHKALVSIKDYLEYNGVVDGKRLADHFSSAPFGWSQDTLRYMIAVLLTNGEVKLKVSGREITVPGQQAIEALRTNTAFRSISVALSDAPPDPEILARASKRMTELAGESVIPLAQNISKAGIRFFPNFQQRYGSLGEKLANLDLPGVERIQTLKRDIQTVLETDASDLPKRLGGEESALYENIKWAEDVHQALKQGLEAAIKDLGDHVAAIRDLPDAGLPGNLKNQVINEILLPVAERLDKENFYQYADDINTVLTTIQASVSATVNQMVEAQAHRLREEKEYLQALYDWKELTQEEQDNQLARIDQLRIQPISNLQGLKAIVAQDYIIQTTITEVRRKIKDEAEKRRKERLINERIEVGDGGKLIRKLIISSKITDLSQLDAILNQLREIRKELELYKEIEISIDIED